MDNLIRRFHDYQVKWLTSHNDIEFCKEEEDLIIRFLHDTADCFIKEMDVAVTDEVMQPEHKCDTCKYEKSLWFNRCADCSDYELWEAKE